MHRPLFHLSSWDFDGEVTSRRSFKSTFKQLYFGRFAEYHIETKLFITIAAVIEHR